MNLFAELKRRRVFRVAGVYALAAWAMIEVSDTIFPRLNLPEWTVTLVIALALLGFPVAVGLAWAFDLTPEGLQRTPHDPGLAKPAAKVFNWKTAVASGVVAFLLFGLTAGGYVMLRSSSEATDENALSIAALPFENLSSDQEDSYFTDGFHDELLTQLSKIGSLRVISRTSVLGYKGTTRNLKTIADELGVRYILEGSVRRFGERVKITAQLIDSRNDGHVWAETYERDRADLFAIQAEVATAIAQAMNVKLTPQAKAGLAALPTTSTEAHDLYLRALDYSRAGGSSKRELRGEQWLTAAAMFEKAAVADPRFALAYAELGIAHLRLYWFGYDKTEPRRNLAKQAIDRALELDAALPQANSALGYYHYWGRRDYDAALRAWTTAQNDLPGSTDIAELGAYVFRRMGRFEKTIELLNKSVVSDPRNSLLAMELGRTYFAARNYEQAMRWATKSTELSPEFPQPYIERAEIALASRGDIAAARAALAAGLSATQSTSEVLRAAYRVETIARSHAQALRYAEQLPGELIEAQEQMIVPALFKALALQALNRHAEARPQLERARQLLEARLAASPDDYRIIQPLALTYAALGDRARAATQAQRLLELMPIGLDASTGAFVAETVAEVYVLVGDPARATEQLSLLNSKPTISALRPALLRIDGRWDGIRNTPEFQRLIQ